MSVRVVPTKLEIASFRSFDAPIMLRFPARGELLGVVSGSNEIEPDLGANGTGKSTLWDALCWCLYGKTIRGLRGAHLIPWKSAGSPHVVFSFRSDDGDYRISRHAKPSVLLLFKGDSLEGEEIGQDRVEALVGMDYWLFSTIVVQGQFSRGFLDYTPKEKLDFLSRALGLELWERAAEKAAIEMKEKLARVSALQAKEADASVRLEETETGIGHSSRELVLLVKEERSLTQDREVEVAAIEGELIQLDEKTKEARLQVSRADSIVEAIARNISRAQRRKEVAVGRAAKATALVQVARGSAARLRTDLESLRSLRGSCPTCHSPITAESKGGAIRAVRSDLREATAEEARAEKRNHRLQRRVRLIVEQFSTLGAEYGRAEDARSTGRKMLGNLKGRQRTLEGRLAALQSPKSRTGIDLLRKRIEAAKVRSAELRRTFAKLTERLAGQRRKASHVQFWVQGFKDMRLWIIRAALDELEAIANSHILDLGLRGWRLNFDVERASASGGIIRGFNVTVISPKSPESVPWEAWSGGEIQRLRIATQAAMIDLVRSRMGGGWLFEVWDEPTAHLSAAGITDLTRFFRERARLLQNEIWIVDHRTLCGGDFTFEIRVTKGQTGSRVHQHRR